MAGKTASGQARGGSAAPVVLAAIVGFVFSLCLLYPGQYSFDSAFQIWQARTGEFWNITPVSMIGLWSLLIAATDNPASLLFLNLVLFWTGLALCVQSLHGHWAVRVATLIVCGWSPLALVQMAHLLSDSHLTAVLVVSAGLIAYCERKPATWLAALTFLLLVYAGTIRQNAVIAIMPLAGLAFVAWLQRGAVVFRPALMAALSAGVLSVTAGYAVSQVLADHHRPIWPHLALWDLAAISVMSETLELPPFTHGNDLTVTELQQTGAFNPVSSSFLFERTKSGIGSGLGKPYSSEQQSALAVQWLASIAHHPAAYLRHRLKTMSLLLGHHDGDPSGVAYYFDRATYRDNPTLPKPWLPRVQASFYDLASALRPGWLFSALPYLLAHIGVLIVAWRSVRTRSRLALAISASAVLYSASFLILAPSTDLRYLTWPIIAAPLAVALSWRQKPARLPWPGKQEAESS